MTTQSPKLRSLFLNVFSAGALAAILTWVVVTHSLEFGKLAIPPDYDDSHSMVEGGLRALVWKQDGAAAAFVFGIAIAATLLLHGVGWFRTFALVAALLCLPVVFNVVHDFRSECGMAALLFPACAAAMRSAWHDRFSRRFALASGCLLALVASACNIVRHDGRFIMARRRFEDQVVMSGREILRRCIKTSANLVGEPVTVMARAASFRKHSFNPEFAYYTDLELWLRITGDQSVGFVGEPLCSFRVHRSACSWGQQGRAYEEFLQLESLHPDFALQGSVARGARWFRGQLLIFTRTCFYRIFG